MPRCSCSSSEYHKILNRRAAGDAYLGAKNAMLSDLHIVADLNVVVDFRSFANPRWPESTPIDGRIGPDLYIRFDFHPYDLRFFFVSLPIEFESESIGPNNDA